MNSHKVNTANRTMSRRLAFHMSFKAVLGAVFAKFIGRSQKSFAAAAPTKRLAIVGAGMGGIASAYFSGSEWQVDLFEAEAQIGGHADTRRVHVDDTEVSVDLGAEFFEPHTHPLYWSLLAHIGARTSDSRTDLTVACAADLTIFSKTTGESLFCSHRPLEHPIYALNFFGFTKAALKFIQGAADPLLTMGQWIDGLKLDPNFKSKILQPWLSSLTCTDVTLMRRESAKAHLSAFSGTFPTNPFKKAITYNSKIGLGGYLHLLINRCENLNIRLNTPVQNLEEVDGQWFVTTPEGREGPYDAVVVNAPPIRASKFFDGNSWAGDLIENLQHHEYFPSRVVIHEDPIYMSKDAKQWSTQNAEVDEGGGEGSIAVGSILEVTHGQKLSLYKSWALVRKRDPTIMLADRTFLHSLSTPSSMKAIEELQAWQGYRGLYFAGHFTTTGDLQETALYSALKTARQLSPNSSRLLAFEDRLKKEKLTHIHYDVRS